MKRSSSVPVFHSTDMSGKVPAGNKRSMAIPKTPSSPSNRVWSSRIDDYYRHQSNEGARNAATYSNSGVGIAGKWTINCT